MTAPWIRSQVRTLLAGRFHLGDRNAESRREVSHRLLEIDLLLQLDELEYVAAHATAEAVEEAAFPHDVERRRLLAVKRAQSLVGIARLAQRDGVRNDGDNVGRRSNFVDTGLGELQGFLNFPFYPAPTSV